MVHAQKDIVMPERFRVMKTKKDSAENYQYYKNHYYDNIDFSDYALSNTPILAQRNNFYFDKVLTQMPDTIGLEAVKMCNKAAKNPILYKNLISTLTDKFIQSKIMGMDKAFVIMVDSFFETNKVTWLDKARLFRIKNRARELRPCLIGKPAFPLVLKDNKNITQELYSIKAKYTIVMFWDPDCGHCKEEMPKVISFYNSHKPKGVELYSVTTENEFDKWNSYITTQKLPFINVWDKDNEANFRNYYDIATTPQFFVLDKNKTIIAKRLSADNLGDFIEKYEKLNNIK